MSSPSPESNTWVVEAIAGVPTSEPRPSISLGEGGLLTGTTGVNRLVGTYVAEAERIKVEGTGMTRMAGPPEAMEQERRLLRALEGWQSLRIGNDRLHIGPAESGLVCVLAQPDR
ncbi:META domain-containing protein [Terrabacter sp. NPDC080008]|uniref:META domain-containing protein n=1 Tax=Terrabacter sp. NPDC080008 TaxID=3155176 RepID=UPI00344BC682